MICGSAESDVALLPSNSGHRKARARPAQLQPAGWTADRDLVQGGFLHYGRNLLEIDMVELVHWFVDRVANKLSL